MKSTFFYKQLGERILTERKRKKITQEELAWVSELDRTYLARIEEGKANPSIRILYKIARQLKIKLHILIGEI